MPLQFGIHSLLTVMIGLQRILFLMKNWQN